MKLSPHFSLKELTRSSTATTHGIDNTPHAQHIQNLQQLASTLEAVRKLFDKPIVITSAYRCKALNQAVGGSNTSDHVNGLAADFTVKGVPVEDACKTIAASNIQFDQLIFEQTWVHLGIGAKMRRQVFSIKGSQKANGIVRL